MIPLSYNVRSLMVRKTTTFATVGGIALVVMLFAAVFMLGNGVKKTLGRSGHADVAIVLRIGSDAELSSGIEHARLAEIQDAAGNVPAIGELVVVVTVDKAGGGVGVSNVPVRGVPAEVFAFRPEIKIIEGTKPTAGTDEVIVGRAIRGRFKGMEMGGEFTLKKGRPMKVVGVFDSAGSVYESEVWADLDTVRSTFGRPALYSAVRLKLPAESKFEPFKLQVEANKRLGLKVQRESEYYAAQAAGTSDLLVGLATAVAVFFALGAILGAAITMYAAVAHRRKEIGTLRALGFSRSSILASFLFEAGVLAAAGGAVGVLLSLALGTVEFPLLNAVTWSEQVFRLETSPKILWTSLAIALVMGLVGGLLPAIRAARMSPVTAIRGG